jgi:hypothetical protein
LFAFSAYDEQLLMAISRRARKLIAITLVTLPALIFVYVTVGLFVVHRKNGVPFSYRNAGTDLIFASSSGRWTAEEDLLRGKHFEDIVVAHELYKVQCDHPAAILVRVKPKKKPWNWAFWFDDYDDLKWRVPYVPTETTKDRESCASRLPSEAEVLNSEQAAREYMALLGVKQDS